MHIVPQVWDAAQPILAGALERAEDGATEPQVLIVTPDTDSALELARRFARAGRRIVPLGEGGRAARLLREEPAPVVAGPVAALAALLRATTLKLAGVKAVVILWADEVVDRAAAEALDAFFAELPKEAARIAITATATEEFDAFADRQMFKARRIGEPHVESASPTDLEYLMVADGARAGLVARLLDELDPASAAIVVRDDASRAEVRHAVASLGYGTDATVRVADAVPEAQVALLVLFEAPAKTGEMEAVARAGAQRVVVLVRARELAHLRALAGRGRLMPFVLPGAGQKAREREVRLRAELRAILDAGIPAREVVALEPLLADYDAVEVAAAALRLMERARQQKSAVTQVQPSGGLPSVAQAAASAAFKRIFMTVGSMDGATIRDIFGAVANAGGLAKEQLGKVEVKESFSLVEIAADQIDRVSKLLDGIMIKGRRANVRLDQERSARTGGSDRPGPRSSGERPARGGERPPRAGGARPFKAGGDRPFKSGGDRPFKGGDRPFRSAGGDRPRSGGASRPDRGGSDRPARPSFDRGERSGGPRSAAADRGGERSGPGGPPRYDRNTPEPRHPGGERVDFEERAERMRRAKRTRDDAPRDDKPRDDKPRDDAPRDEAPPRDAGSAGDTGE